MLDISQLNGVEQTLFIPLIIKAHEYTHKNPIIRDEHAFAMIKQLDLKEADFRINAFSRVATLFRARKFDSHVGEYLNQYPTGTIIEIGAGLDTRCHRTDNGKARWICIDLPEVIKLRKKLIPDSDRIKNVTLDITHASWNAYASKNPALVLAEGVLMYIEKLDVMNLIKNLGRDLAGSTFCFDIISSFVFKKQSFKALAKNNVVMKWGIDDIREMINPQSRCKLLEEWKYYSQFEKRYGVANLFRFVPKINNMFRIVKVQLNPK